MTQTVGVGSRGCEVVRISETGYTSKVGSPKLAEDGMWSVEYLFFKMGKSVGRVGLGGMGKS